MKSPFSLLLGFLIAGVLVGSTSAHAGVRIVPESRGAVNLKPKALSLKTEIAGRFARTTALWTFANSAKTAFEAEFVADAPREAVVTGFAYYFKKEKVIARVVEKLRAAEIYRGIVQQRRDPALVEMLSRNTFRARISPVAPGDDVRIETVWVQPLSKEKDGWAYEVPLRDKGDETKIDWQLKVSVWGVKTPHIKANFEGADGENGAFSNQAGTAMPDTLHLTLQDALSAQPIRSNSGAADYFAIRTAPGEQVVMPPKATQVWRNSTKMGTTIVGRLPRAASIKPFGDVAEKLWAAAEIDILSRDSKNQTKVLALSKRYGLTSKWTSWLAIPEEERQRLKPIIEREKRAQASVNIRNLGVAMAQEIAQGRVKGSAYAKMKVQFDANCRIVDSAPQDMLRGVVDEQMYYQYSLIGYAQYGNNGKKKTQQEAMAYANNLMVRMQRLAPYASERGERNMAYAKRRIREVEMEYLTPAWINSRLKGKEDVAKRKRIVQILRSVSAWKESQDEWRYSYAEPLIVPFAERWAQLKKSGKATPQQISAARREVEKVAQVLPTTQSYQRQIMNSVLSYAEYSKFNPEIDAIKSQLAEEIAAKREDGAKAQDLRRDLATLGKKLEFPAGHNLSPNQLPMGRAIRKVVAEQQEIELKETKEAPDAARLASLQAELDRLKNYTVAQDATSANKGARKDVLEKEQKQLIDEWVRVAKTEGGASEQATKVQKELQRILDLKFEVVKDDYHRSSEQAESFLKYREQEALSSKSWPLRKELVEEMGALRPDNAKIVRLQTELETLEKATAFNKTMNSEALPWNKGEALNMVLGHLRAERAKPKPDETLIADLERRAIDLQEFDNHNRMWATFTGGRHDQDPKKFGQLRVERIKVRSEREKAQQRLAKSPNDIDLRDEVAKWLEQENQLRVRMGDPLIAVAAPQNARQVLAVFPSGEMKQLEWNALTKRWEARFDVPTWSNAGDYAVQIIVVFQSGVRQTLKMHFAVDTEAPSGQGRLALNGQNWVLRMETGEQTDRVTAFLPWSQRVELKRQENAFVGEALAPEGFAVEKSAVRFVLTDKAHNRTEVWVDFEG